MSRKCPSFSSQQEFDGESTGGHPYTVQQPAFMGRLNADRALWDSVKSTLEQEIAARGVGYNYVEQKDNTETKLRSCFNEFNEIADEAGTIVLIWGSECMNRLYEGDGVISNDIMSMVDVICANMMQGRNVSSDSFMWSFAGKGSVYDVLRLGLKGNTDVVLEEIVDMVGTGLLRLNDNIQALLSPYRPEAVRWLLLQHLEARALRGGIPSVPRDQGPQVASVPADEAVPDWVRLNSTRRDKSLARLVPYLAYAIMKDGAAFSGTSIEPKAARWQKECDSHDEARAYMNGLDKAPTEVHPDKITKYIKEAQELIRRKGGQSHR